MLYITGGAEPVGSYNANPYGLYDIYGNVWEWVEDCSNWPNPYKGVPTNGDPWLAKNCHARILRGGAWDSGEYDLSSASRYAQKEKTAWSQYGFRIALD